MNDPDKNPTLVIKAEIHVQFAESLGQYKGIEKGFASSLLFDGNRYPSQIVDCVEPLRPGCSGYVTMFMLDSLPTRSNIHSGSEFRLMYGPLVAATGRVVSVSELV